MLNRTNAPAFKQIDNIELIRAEEIQLDNGIPVYRINGGTQDLVRIEFIFNNVNWDKSKPLQAFAVNSMLSEGTSKFSAMQIADEIDYYGAFFQTDYNFDHSTVVLYSLNKHLKSTLPVVKEVMTDSVFPEAEMQTFVRNNKQKLSVNLEKNDFLGRRLFNKALFGESVYGFSSNVEDYDALDSSQLKSYFKLAYQPANCTIVISGKIDNTTIALINQLFGKEWDNGGAFKINKFSLAATPKKEHYLEREGALQSAIRIGGLSIQRNHPDFPAMQVLNTVLGGYFGSRLMANIREDKGYTYGIGSALVSLQNAGYFFIASEVGADVCEHAVKEIQKEIDTLKTTLIPEEELALVKNYMLGSFLGGLENAFSHADKFKNIHFSGLTYEYYKNYMDKVKLVSSKELQSLANQYFNFEDFEKVIVGRR